MENSSILIVTNLDVLQKHIPYRLGRLFALIERLQGIAYPKIASNVHDRFWAQSLRNPASGFQVPLQMVPTYLGRIPRMQQRKFKRMLDDLSNDLPVAHLPQTMSMTEQGLFSLGYCYQRTTLVGGTFGGQQV